MRDKLGRFIKGCSSSPETQFKKGEQGYWLGKKRPGISQKLKGKKLSIEHIEKLRASHLGQKPWNKGIYTGIKPWLGKKRLNMTGDKNYAWKGGLPNCKICLKKLSTRKATYCQNCANKIYQSGEKNNNWRGGVTPQNLLERKSPAYRRWHRACLKRDNYKCIWCGSREDLEVDHIKPFALYKELRTEITNGRTLCLKCHQKTFIFYENQYHKRKEVFSL